MKRKVHSYIFQHQQTRYNSLMKEWSSEGYGMIKGALCTGVCEGGLVVEEAVVRTLVRGCSDVAAVEVASALC